MRASSSRSHLLVMGGNLLPIPKSLRYRRFFTHGLSARSDLSIALFLQRGVTAVRVRQHKDDT